MLAHEPGRSSTTRSSPPGDAVAVVQEEDHGRAARLTLAARRGPAAAIVVPTRDRAALPRRGARVDRRRRRARAGAERDRGRRRARRGDRARSPRATARATSPTTRPRGLNAARNTGARRHGRAAARASSTTTSRCAPAGSPRCCARPRRVPRRGRRPHRPDPRAHRGPPLPHVRARGAADHVPRPRARRRATPSTRGARTWRSAAARSSASGRFDEALELYGDEEEWQARLQGRRRADPLRRRAPALDHRRAGDDARLRALARAAYRRGRASRRFDAQAARAPSLGARAAHARRLRRCTARAARCMNGAGDDRRTAPAACARRSRGAGRRDRRRRRTSSRAPAAPSAAGAARCARRATPARRARRAAAGARLRRAARHDAAAPARARRSASSARRPDLHGRARAPSCSAPATTSTSVTAPAGERGQVREPQRAARRAPARRLDWLLVLDDDVALPRGFLDRFLASPSAPACGSPSPRTACTPTPPGRSRAGARASPRARRRFVEIGPVTAFHRDTFGDAAAVPRPAHGLGPRRPLGGAGARARLADRRSSTPRRSATRCARPAAATRATRPRPRRARSSPSRPYVRRDEVRTLRDAREGRGRRASSTRAPHDPVLGVWAHRQALAARDAGADVRVLVLHRPVPPRRRALRDAPRAAARACSRQPRHASSTASTSRYVPFLAPPRPRTLRPLGRVGGADAGARAAPAAPRASRSTSSTPTTPCPAADAVLRAAHRARRSSSPSTAATSSTPRPRHAGGRAAVAPRASARARLVLANSRRHRGAPRATLGARDTRVVHLGTDLPDAARAAPRAPHRSSPSATSSRASATPTCCARCGCCATATRRCATSSSATAPSARRSSGLAAELGRRRPRRASPASSRTREALARGPRGARCSCMPSVDEAFGVAYVEAMAGGVPAIGARGEPGPRGDRRAGGGHAARRRPATSRRWPPSSTRCCDEPRCAQELGAPRARTVERALHLGGAAGARPSPPTRTRCGEARSCSSPTTSPPDRAGAFARAARARGRSSSRSSAAARTTRRPGRRPRRPAPPRRASARSTRWPPSGRYRAVVCGTAGRVALPAACARRAPRRRAVRALERAVGATRARRRTALARPLLRRIYRDADAVVDLRPARRAPTSARRGARTRRRRAAGGRQRFWARAGRRADAPRAVPGAVRRARRAREGPRGAARGLARAPALGRRRGLAVASATRTAGARAAGAGAQLLRAARTFWSYRRSPPAHFREPWGLVVNEAMNQALPVIATDAVGAAAGGLVRDERTGLVVPAGDADALAAALRAPARRPRAARAARRRRGARRRRLHPRGVGGRLRRRPAQRDRRGRSLASVGDATRQGNRHCACPSRPRHAPIC